mgnify:CR=1 FL=1
MPWRYSPLPGGSLPLDVVFTINRALINVKLYFALWNSFVNAALTRTAAECAASALL